jgi:hypothetical protein
VSFSEFSRAAASCFRNSFISPFARERRSSSQLVCIGAKNDGGRERGDGVGIFLLAAPAASVSALLYQ